jgi:hypothetical protein
MVFLKLRGAGQRSGLARLNAMGTQGENGR